MLGTPGLARGMRERQAQPRGREAGARKRGRGAASVQQQQRGVSDTQTDGRAFALGAIGCGVFGRRLLARQLNELPPPLLSVPRSAVSSVAVAVLRFEGSARDKLARRLLAFGAFECVCSRVGPGAVCVRLFERREKSVTIRVLVGFLVRFACLS